jgi:hypothetical protein
MSANSWGFFGTGLAVWLTMIGLPSQYLWLQPWFILGGGVSFVASAVCFFWPVLRHGARTAAPSLPATPCRRQVPSAHRASDAWGASRGGPHGRRAPWRACGLCSCARGPTPAKTRQADPNASAWGMVRNPQNTAHARMMCSARKDSLFANYRRAGAH